MLGALGDFESPVYREGWDRHAATAMFLLATFFISVVFMNMLIAIRGETVGTGTEEAEQSGLQEQVVLIADFSWLVDLKKAFKGQKYIIRVRPSSSSQEASDAVERRVGEAEANLQKKLDKIRGAMVKRIDGVDSHTRFLMKYQQNSIERLSKRLRGVEKMLGAALSKGAEDEEL